MAYIRIETEKLDNAIKAIKEFVLKATEDCDKVSNKVLTMQNFFQGDDSKAFTLKWLELVRSSDSTYTKMLEEMNRYAEYLEFVKKKYEEAREEVLAKAQGIPQ